MDHQHLEVHSRVEVFVGISGFGGVVPLAVTAAAQESQVFLACFEPGASWVVQSGLHFVTAFWIIRGVLVVVW